MSHGHRNEGAYYDATDDSDGEYETVKMIQIDLPSTRLELKPNHYLYRDKTGEMRKVMAHNIQVNDLVYIYRDDEMTTEGVLQKKTVYRRLIDDFQITVNNVLVSFKD